MFKTLISEMRVALPLHNKGAPVGGPTVLPSASWQLPVSAATIACGLILRHNKT